MRKGRIKYWFKSKKEIINDVGFLCDRVDELENKIKKATEKIESVRIFGIKSGKTLISTLLNEVEDILKGEDKWQKKIFVKCGKIVQGKKY